LRRCLALLPKYSLQEYADPVRFERLGKDEWKKIVKTKTVQLELEERRARLAARASTAVYANHLMNTTKKPAQVVVDAANPLGRWVLVHLRAGSLPLLQRAGHWSVHPWSAASRRCVFCDLEAEDEMHFVATCPSTQFARDELWLHLRAKAEELPSAPVFKAELRRLCLLAGRPFLIFVLGGLEAVSKLEPGSSFNEVCRVLHKKCLGLSQVCARVCADFLANIWRWRCRALGGVLLPSPSGIMTLEPVKKDFRCRLF
jgi:hypothetical protein